MNPEFNVFEYASYLGTRWRTIAGSCVLALMLTGGITLLLPKRYTATATILIDPPAGNDSRTATAVSPVYLESLKTYEHFASSDTLFRNAVLKFQLNPTNEPLENMKRRILRVGKVRDTKILEVAVTLNDPERAQLLAQFLAQETIRLSQTLLRDGEDDLLQEAQRQMQSAQARFDAAQSASGAFASKSSIDGLKAELDSAAELKSRIRRESIEAGARAADLASRANEATDLAGARARVSALEKQGQELEREWASKNSLLAAQQATHSRLSTELDTAKRSLDASVARYREVQNATGYRGERLKLIDPGVVPQRPSSPNLMLNLFAAFLAALAASVVFLSFGFVWKRNSATALRNRPVSIDR